MTNTNHRSYPLIEDDLDSIQAASGRSLSHITPNAVQDLPLTIDDLTIHAETLRAQAQIAYQAGHAQLATNLRRAAELTLIPNSEVLRLYTMLRPKRASYKELNDLADMLENTYDAIENGRLIREAAEAYQARGLLKPD